MRVSQISIVNYCGARSVSVLCKEPVTMFVGDNGAGKSSIKEAVRHALCGTPTRAGTRKDEAAALVTEGARAGKAYVAFEANGFECSVLVALPQNDIEANGMLPSEAVMDCVTDARVFAQVMDGSERRSFLFNLLGVQVTPEAVMQLLVNRGCDSYFAEQAAAMVHSGFEAACEYAKDRAKEARGAWRSITGETYGLKKGETWKASYGEPYDEKAHDADIEHAARIQDDIQFVAEEIGALEMAAGFSGFCPHCGGMVAIRNGVLVEHDGAEVVGNIEEKREALAFLRERLRILTEACNAHEARKTAEATCERATEAARAAHDEVKAWVQIAEHLAPEGVPSEMLAQAVEPFNASMTGYACLGCWKAPRLDSSLELKVDDRPYALLSESEQWRVDAVAALSIAKLSGVRFVSLDRFDVLDMQGREQLLSLLESAVKVNDVDSVLLFGTLKTTPPSEPGFMQVHRVVNGVASNGDQS